MGSVLVSNNWIPHVIFFVIDDIIQHNVMLNVEIEVIMTYCSAALRSLFFVFLGKHWKNSLIDSFGTAPQVFF